MFGNVRSFFIGDKLHQMRDYRDRVRAITNFNFSVILFLGFLVALIPALLSDRSDILQLPVFAGLGFSIILLFSNKFIQSAKAVGFIFVILGLGVAFGNLFLNTEVLHIGAPLWILVVLLYSFFNVGLIWSLIVTILSFSIYVGWIVYFLNDEVQRVADQIPDITPLLVLEVSIAFVILVAMILVYLRSITSNERQLVLKNKQLKLNQWSIEEDQFRFFNKVRFSMDNHHKYLSMLQELQNKGLTSEYLQKQFEFSSIVFKALSHQNRYNAIDPGTLITSILSFSSATFSNKQLNYIFDNTIDFIEEKYVLPLSYVLTMLVYSTSKSDKTGNISVNYFYDGGEVVFRYQDDCLKHDYSEDKDRIHISSMLVSDVGGKYEQKDLKERSFVDIRFPL